MGSTNALKLYNLTVGGKKKIQKEFSSPFFFFYFTQRDWQRAEMWWDVPHKSNLFLLSPATNLPKEGFLSKG